MTAWLRNAPAVVERLVRACPPASPRRAWLLSGLLAINLVLVLLPAASAQRMELLGFGAWIEQLEADTEGTPANTYSSVVWGAVALLAVAQLLRPTPSSQRRWLWRLGWLSVALLTALIAFEESVSLKETSTASVDSAIQKLEVVPSGFHWLSVVAVPLAAPLAAAGWVLVTSQRGHPARALVLVVVAALSQAPFSKTQTCSVSRTLPGGDSSKRAWNSWPPRPSASSSSRCWRHPMVLPLTLRGAVAVVPAVGRPHSR